MIMNSANNKEVDILRMLTKAKDEYTKVSLAAGFTLWNIKGLILGFESSTQRDFGHSHFV